MAVWRRRQLQLFDFFLKNSFCQFGNIDGTVISLFSFVFNTLRIVTILRRVCFRTRPANKYLATPHVRLYKNSIEKKA